MNSEVAQWLYQHREHLSDAVGSTPAELFFEFLSDPTRLIETRDIQDPGYDAISDGCNYIFQRGFHAGQKCSREKCRFHQHVIFSTEYQKEVKELHLKINKEAFTEVKPTVEISVQVFGKGRYIDPVHKLILENPGNEIQCVGYLPVKGGEVQPLTQELIDYCDSMTISYIPDVNSDSQQLAEGTDSVGVNSDL